MLFSGTIASWYRVRSLHSCIRRWSSGHVSGMVLVVSKDIAVQASANRGRKPRILIRRRWRSLMETWRYRALNSVKYIINTGFRLQQDSTDNHECSCGIDLDTLGRNDHEKWSILLHHCDPSIPGSSDPDFHLELYAQLCHIRAATSCHNRKRSC